MEKQIDVRSSFTVLNQYITSRLLRTLHSLFYTIYHNYYCRILHWQFLQYTNKINKTCS